MLGALVLMGSILWIVGSLCYHVGWTRGWDRAKGILAPEMLRYHDEAAWWRRLFLLPDKPKKEWRQ